MRVPQVKEAPAQALRAMFAGIGQMLHISDKLRGKSAASPNPETVVPATAAPKTAATPASAPEATAPETIPQETAAPETATPEAAGGHVRLIEPEPAPAVAADTAPAAAAADTAPAAAAPADAAPAAEADAAPAAEADAVPASAVAADRAPSAELPLANYDDLTIASLRARLRNLSTDQLGQLIEYEKSHAGRADVISMFERRIAKLAEG
jgi:hypothetical protein